MGRMRPNWQGRAEAREFDRALRDAETVAEQPVTPLAETHSGSVVLGFIEACRDES